MTTRPDPAIQLATEIDMAIRESASRYRDYADRAATHGDMTTSAHWRESADRLDLARAAFVAEQGTHGPVHAAAIELARVILDSLA